MRTIEYFKRLLSVFYIYSAKLIITNDTKRISGAPKMLRLTTKQNG